MPAQENDELVAWEKQELTKFRREKAKFGADYLEGPKNKARLARMLELERKYPDHGAMTEQRSNVIKFLAQTTSMRNLTVLHSLLQIRQLQIRIREDLAISSTNREIQKALL